MDEVIEAREAYFAAFGNAGPRPFEVSDRDLVAALRQAVKDGQPIPDDYDWYGDVPDGAAV